MAPALDKIQQDLHFSSSTMGVISLSVYLLGVAIVPLFTAPLSEIFGRMIVLQATDILFIAFNTLCGISRTPNQLIGLRFLAGLGGAGANTVRIILVHHASNNSPSTDHQRWALASPQIYLSLTSAVVLCLSISSPLRSA